MSNPETCPHCGSRNLVTITDGVPPPHHAKLVCGDCLKHLKWLAGPIGDFIMPFGKYRGSTLREIDRADHQHLTWIATLPDYSNNKIQEKVREYLRQIRETSLVPGP